MILYAFSSELLKAIAVWTVWETDAVSRRVYEAAIKELANRGIGWLGL